MHADNLYTVRYQHTQAAGQRPQDPERRRTRRPHGGRHPDRAGVHSAVPGGAGADTADNNDADNHQTGKTSGFRRI